MRSLSPREPQLQSQVFEARTGPREQVRLVPAEETGRKLRASTIAVSQMQPQCIRRVYGSLPNCALVPVFSEGEGGKQMGHTRTYVGINTIPDTTRRLRGAPRQPTGGSRATAGQMNYRLHLRGPRWRRLGRLGRITNGVTVVSQCSATGTESWIGAPAWVERRDTCVKHSGKFDSNILSLFEFRLFPVPPG